jgi:hypothetical protein
MLLLLLSEWLGHNPGYHRNDRVWFALENKSKSELVTKGLPDGSIPKDGLLSVSDR